MVANIAMGLLLTAVTVVVHSAGLIALSALTRRAVLREVGGALTDILVFTGLCCGVCILLGVEIALWAAAFLWLGALPDFESSLYFSISTFSTTGFGDVMPTPEWQVFCSLEAIIGFLIIGWSSAYMVAAGIRFGPFERDKHF